MKKTALLRPIVVWIPLLLVASARTYAPGRANHHGLQANGGFYYVDLAPGQRGFDRFGLFQATKSGRHYIGPVSYDQYENTPFLDWRGGLMLRGEGKSSSHCRTLGRAGQWKTITSCPRGVWSADGRLVATARSSKPDLLIGEQSSAESLIIRTKSGERIAEWPLSQINRAAAHKVVDPVLIRWASDGRSLAVCFAGKRMAEPDEEERLTYVFDLKSQRVRFVGYGFNALWVGDKRLLLTGRLSSLPAKQRPTKLRNFNQQTFVDDVNLVSGKRVHRLYQAALAASARRHTVVWLQMTGSGPADAKAYLIEASINNPHQVRGPKVAFEATDALNWHDWLNRAVAIN